MPQKLKQHLFSAGITFISMFLGSLAVFAKELATSDVNSLSAALVVGLLASAARAAGKAVFEDLFKTDVLFGVKKQ